MTSSDAISSLARVTVEALFNGLWQGIALCVFVGGALACYRRANAATRYAIWWMALVVMAVLPLLRPVPRRTLPRPAPATQMTIVRSPEPPAPSHIAVPALPFPPRVVRQSGVPLATVHVRDRWPLVLFCLWLAGAALMMTRLGWSFLHILRLRRASAPPGALYQGRLERWLAISGGARRVKLCAVEGITTPMSAGPLDPLILIPADFSGRLTEAEFDHVLLHELAHIRRGDNWTNLLQKVIEALLFFQPAVWFAAKRLNLERESACDDWVIHLTGEAKSYAACLAKLAEVSGRASQPVLATGIFRGAKQISTRIERLLDLSRNRTPRVATWAVVPALLFLMTAAFVCSEVRTVLAGPVPVSTIARMQPLAFAPQAPSQEPAPRTNPTKPQPPQVKERPGGAEDQVEAFPPENQDQFRELDERLQSMRSQALDAQARAKQQLLQLQQNGLYDELKQQLLQLQKDGVLDDAKRQMLQLQQEGTEQLFPSKNFEGLEAQLLASQEALRRAAEAETSSHQSNGWWTGLNVRSKGQIQFTDDDSDVKSVSPGGYLSIEERRGFTTRKYEATSSERRYSVNGHPHPIDDEAKGWLTEVLPQVIRDSAIEADARVKRILKQRGPNSVLDDIAKISSDHARRIYFTELFTNGALPDDVLRRAARQMGREIASDGEKARLLIDVADAYLKDAGQKATARVEYFEAVGTIASDGEHRRVLSNALQKDGRNKETLLLALQSVSRIASDGEKARLLMEAADAPAFDASLSADFLHAVNTIASDGEHARVLMALLRLNGLGQGTLVMVMQSAGRIASDGEKGRVLARASEFYTSDPAIRTAFFNAAASIASDGDHSRVLLAILAKTSLDKESFVEIIRSAAHIASDGEKGRVLRQVAAVCPNDEAVVAALVEAAETIASDGEYRRVMSTMLGRSELSVKITKIKHT